MSKIKKIIMYLLLSEGKRKLVVKGGGGVLPNQF